MHFQINCNNHFKGLQKQTLLLTSILGRSMYKTQITIKQKEETIQISQQVYHIILINDFLVINTVIYCSMKILIIHPMPTSRIYASILRRIDSTCIFKSRMITSIIYFIHYVFLDIFTYYQQINMKASMSKQFSFSIHNTIERAMF